jgi:hypothetical protein
LVLLMVNDKESCLELHLDAVHLHQRDAVHLHQRDAVHLHQRDGRRILVGPHLDGCPPLEDAHLDGSDGWLVDAE